MSAPVVPPISDELPIALRAFVGPKFRTVSDGPPAKRKKSKLAASPWTVIFDTETTTDPGQALRFGTYQVRNAGALHEAGIFFDPDGVSNSEVATLRAYADANGLRLLTRDQFIDEIFFAIGWQLRASIVGFNLPFDISRIAIAHGSARTEMRGGFSFTLSRQKIYPHVQVKHLSRRMAFIRFAATAGQLDSRGQRKRGLKTSHRAGHFVDVKTLGGALFARSFSLAGLSTFLKVENPKLEFDEFSGPVTADMIAYAVRDVQTTWECYSELCVRLASLGLPELHPEHAYSEASIGKAYIRAMGITPFLKSQPNFPRKMLGTIMGTYYGGRSEIRIRREIRQVILCDFLSMYPTVCTLMGLWRFVIASGMTWREATVETRQFLETADLGSLQSQATWPRLATLVRISPQGDIFPVRAAYSGEPQVTIGANHLTTDYPLWFTLADCIAAKLLTGKAPKIIESIAFEPGPIQTGMQPIDISGNPDYRVDPANTDFFKRAIELRQSVKERRDAASGTLRDALDTEQHALKIAANATSYGIWVEVNVATLAAKMMATVNNAVGAPFSFATDKAEEPGPFFHPLLATLITGAARLMLALAETLIAKHGLDWAFCDTDSMAIAKPHDMPASDFSDRVATIVDWFAPLNPYGLGGSILKVEAENASLKTGEPERIYCWAISAKRYALFNIAPDRKSIMRKVSAHGLGHLLPPYREADAPSDLPTPHKSVLREGTERWHCDLWHQIVAAAIAGSPDQVRRDYHPALRNPAISRYGATSPELLRWFNGYNAGRSPRDQVKPFGFLLSLSAKPALDGERIVLKKRGRRRAALKPVKPIAPFDRDFENVAASVFDRETGAPVPVSALKSYADALATYHIQPESKFLNGDYLDHGTTLRRHVRMIAAQHIGKESNDWERQAVLGLNDAQPDYGIDDADRDKLFAELARLILRVGAAKVAKALGTTPARLKSFSARSLPRSIAGRLSAAVRLFDKLNLDRKNKLDRLREAVAREGLRPVARRLGIDASNLRRKLR